MPKAVVAAKTATFITDDKRAQYARLIVFNYGVQEKVIAKDADVNTIGKGDMQKAFKSLTGGTLLAGKDGIELIQKLSAKGSTTGRALTTAYAQEVRPFLMKGLLAPTFGRRGSKKAQANGGEAAPAPTKAKAKTSAAKSKAELKREAAAKKAAQVNEETPDEGGNDGSPVEENERVIA